MIKTRADCELGRATLLGFGSRMSRSLLCQRLGSRLLVLLGSCGGVGNFRWQKDQRGKGGHLGCVLGAQSFCFSFLPGYMR